MRIQLTDNALDVVWQHNGLWHYKEELANLCDDWANEAALGAKRGD